MKNTVFYTMLLVAAGTYTARAQQQPIDSLTSEQIRLWLADAHVPAAGIGVIRQGKVVDVRVVGNLTHGIPAVPTTIFNVASLTKPVFALTVLKLVDQGKMSLDEPLASYWVDPDVTNDSRYQKLTPRLVLSHQTGFANWRWDDGGRQLSFQFDPGEKFQYSGEGYEYLRKAIERKMKTSIAQLSGNYLFKPLNMNDTRYTWEESLTSRFARWHDNEGQQAYPTRKTTEPGAADDLLTTVADYARFGLHVLQGGGLSPALYAEMIRPQVKVKEHVDYGLGWLVVKDLPEGEYALVHSGADVGVRAIIILLPQSQRGLVIMTNGDRGNEVIVNIVHACLDIAPQLVAFLK